jgi:hypothetical protein
MGGDFYKDDNSPLDHIKNLAHKSFTGKMEKVFAQLRELIILRMEINSNNLEMPKDQFLEMLNKAGFILNPDKSTIRSLDLTKQIQFIIDGGIKFYKCQLRDDGKVVEWDMEEHMKRYPGVLGKRDIKIVFRW